MDYFLRLKKLRILMEEKKIPILFLDSPVSLFYMTGLKLSSGRLCISRTRAILFVDGRYTEMAKHQTTYPLGEWGEEPLKQWMKEENENVLAFDQKRTSYYTFSHLQSILDFLVLKPVDSPVDDLRLIKEDEEIDCLRKAAQLCCRGMDFAQSLLQEGIQEKELAVALEVFWKKEGGDALSFEPIIAFGSNASMPHHRAGETLLNRNTSVLIDSGVCLNHYHSDRTRVIFFGTPSGEIEKIYGIVQEAHDKALALCRPGIPFSALDQASREWITVNGYGKNFTHSLGHGIGLEVHEFPTIRSDSPACALLLKPGMVFTIEPGIYLPGIGGVRFENTVVITKEGYEILTYS